MIVRVRKNTQQIYQHLCSVIPGGVNSPARSFKQLEMTPIVVHEAKGSKIIDADGREYIDFCGCWGALIHGHAPDFQMFKGVAYGMTTEIEGKLAEIVLQSVPSVEKVRFMNSGTEAVMTAVRMARKFSNKSLILTFEGNYHGHADLGDIAVIPYNDKEAFNHFVKMRGQDIAAILIEAIPANMGVVLPESDFIEAIKDSGLILISDEVITGFRIGGMKGASHLLGLKPDLITFGKVLGGGFPVGAVGGKRQIMDLLAPIGPVFQAGTFAGNPITITAGIAALEKAKQRGFYEELDSKTARFLKKIKQGNIVHIGSMFTIFFQSPEEFTPFFHYLFDHGILFSPSPFEANFISSAHTEDELEYVANTINEYLECYTCSSPFLVSQSY
ncbi:MAG: aminotransferase class III-fold pyridoxal phosphate-dependent enzyme [Chlamydiae bacterium]|nr:aminotransferase class III-fold pyridoxal phosphate-dependent enzyme [Chlamydiota bacterium]